MHNSLQKHELVDFFFQLQDIKAMYAYALWPKGHNKVNKHCVSSDLCSREQRLT